jgi:asparagine synthase (glutamine-hydrolysing)
MLKSGLYGLFRLDGGPVDSRDVAALGFAAPVEPGPAFAIGIDPRAPAAVHRYEADGALTILVGDLEEPDALAQRLHFASAPPAAMLARAVLQRCGDETPVLMVGEWSLLHWDAAGGLTLAMSAARRDRLFYACAGARVAVASDLFRLAAIDWVGRDLDEAGFLFALGREGLRREIGDRTMFSGVRQLEPGTCVVLSAGQLRKRTALAFTPQPRWTGSFEDAVAEAEDLMRGIMRARLARTAVPAMLLSGGLDSSALSWLASEVRGTDQRMLLFTSAAPPGSGLPDETGFADVVAARLGLRCEHMAPPEGANIYRPSDAILAGASGPPLSNRHYLTDTFHAAARAHGATAIFDGNFGELTLTGAFPLTSIRRRLRRLARQLLRAGSAAASSPPRDNPFHVRLSPGRRMKLPEPVRAALHARGRPVAGKRPNEPWGYVPGADKAMLQANEFYAGAYRMELPYRDLRLLRLFAGFPAGFQERNRLGRAPVRHMLAGRLPDSIRLRTSGMPASPDHYARLRRHAPSARMRIAAFRQAELDEWFDLDWLDASLAHIAVHGAPDVDTANQTQLTAIAAEFLLWWRGS